MPPHRVQRVAGGPPGRGLPGAVEGGRTEGERNAHVGREPDGGIAQVHDLLARHDPVRGRAADPGVGSG